MMAGFLILLLFTILAIFSSWISSNPVLYENWHLAREFSQPAWVRFFDSRISENEVHGLLGTDEHGRSVLNEVIWGMRVSLFVGFLATILAVGVGTMVGLVSGYKGGKTDTVLWTITQLVLTLPVYPLLVILVAVYGANMWNIIVIVGAIWWTWTARLIRSQVLTVKERAYVDAARALGAKDRDIMFRHILPNVLPLLFANATTIIAFAILTEASLAFVGLSNPNEISWGTMLFNAISFGAFYKLAWWYIVPPGLCIGLVVLGVYFMGIGAEQILARTSSRQ